MKLNRKRIDVRLPQWLLKRLKEHAEERGWTITQTLELTATKGLKWYEKELKEIKDPGRQSKTTLQSNRDPERCPSSKDNYTEKYAKEHGITYEEAERQIIEIAKAKWTTED